MIRDVLAGLSPATSGAGLGTSDRVLLCHFGTNQRVVPVTLALDARRPLLQARPLLARAGPPKDPSRVHRFTEETWGGSMRRAYARHTPFYLEITTVGLLHPDHCGPIMRDTQAERTSPIASAFRDLGRPPGRAQAEATLLLDTAFGLIGIE
ncbi:TetR/AcrR family transcriptional regulator [Streptomyces aureus]|uniref:TetR/AcrR family transcriptional regulator n=1 Tax=Streptomyces aureus TaxID=193461 RepID=UPI0033E4E2E7